MSPGPCCSPVYHTVFPLSPRHNQKSLGHWTESGLRVSTGLLGAKRTRVTKDQGRCRNPIPGHRVPIAFSHLSRCSDFKSQARLFWRHFVHTQAHVCVSLPGTRIKSAW